MNSYNDPSIMNSELAVQILSHMASEGDKDYGSHIAEQIGKCQTSVCRILTELEKIGFVEKSERKKAQYYRINYDEIVEFWYLKINSKINKTEALNPESYNADQKTNSKIKAIGKNFFREVLSSKELKEIKLQELFFDIFLSTTAEKLKEDEDFLEKNSIMVKPALATAMLVNEKTFPEELEKALNN